VRRTNGDDGVVKELGVKDIIKATAERRYRWYFNGK
jgi:hypothetical protein